MSNAAKRLILGSPHNIKVDESETHRARVLQTQNTTFVSNTERSIFNCYAFPRSFPGL